MLLVAVVADGYAPAAGGFVAGAVGPALALDGGGDDDGALGVGGLGEHGVGLTALVVEVVVEEVGVPAVVAGRPGRRDEGDLVHGGRGGRGLGVGAALAIVPARRAAAVLGAAVASAAVGREAARGAGVVLGRDPVDDGS